jgi:hypothetical protein
VSMHTVWQCFDYDVVTDYVRGKIPLHLGHCMSNMDAGWLTTQHEAASEVEYVGCKVP